MIVHINQTISNILTEEREVLSTRTAETVLLYPEVGKRLRNKKTGIITSTFVVLGTKDSKDNYEEID